MLRFKWKNAQHLSGNTEKIFKYTHIYTSTDS